MGHFVAPFRGYFCCYFMISGILGKKIYQTQRFTKEGKRIPVTVIEAGPCPVVAIKTKEKDGYRGVQLGFGQKKLKNSNKAQIGQSKKAGIENNTPRFFSEMRVNSEKQDEALTLGSVVTISDVFQIGDTIQVVGTSKGKGFAGGVKRHHFRGGPRTHGQSDRERAPGSIGQTTTPGRVYKGKRMAGRMGHQQVTVKNLTVVDIDKEKNLLVIKGLIPGAIRGFVTVRKE